VQLIAAWLDAAQLEQAMALREVTLRIA